jgi:hypothetical protein
VRGEPEVGQQLIELIRGMGRQAWQDIPEVRERIDIMALAGAGQGVEDHRNRQIPCSDAGVLRASV